ncbi:MAG: hypothetical protein HYV63_00895 [Candidatus Schekmanbacteria bacterium]|nr:hypothetical protein [Candidatus Schekmanbacteria bacterium]
MSPIRRNNRWLPAALWPVVAAVITVSSVPSCAGDAGDKPAEQPPAGPAPLRLVVDLPDAVGLSGLDFDERGLLLAVPERRPLLLPLRFDGSRVTAGGPPVPLTGAPPDLDLEAVAAIGPGRIALGTESQERDRAEDTILVVTLHGDRAAVTETLALPYALWELRGDGNRGVEGLCAAGNLLVAAAEIVGTAGKRRFAPVARRPLTGGNWVPYRLMLASETGRISALACRETASGAALEMLAIERHYGVVLLLGFELPTAGPGGDLEPRVLADLTRQLDKAPNFEGVAFLPDGSIALLADNDNGGVIQGQTELAILRLPAPAADTPVAAARESRQREQVAVP